MREAEEAQAAGAHRACRRSSEPDEPGMGAGLCALCAGDRASGMGAECAGCLYARMSGAGSGHELCQSSGDGGAGTADRGRPESLRCNNGPELTSRHFLAWCVERKIQLVHIEPGRPMQNGKVESWRREYNQTRLHSSLGYQTPEAIAAEAAAPPASPPTLAGTSRTVENASLSSMNFVSPSVRT